MSNKVTYSITKLFRFVCAMVAICTATTGNAQISVTATAGTLGPTVYATLNAAINAVNAGTHQGAVLLSVTASTTETVQSVLNSSGTGAASYTSVTIKPAIGVTPTIQGNIANSILQLLGADNVTIDGSNAAGGTSRDLTMTNTTASTATSSVIWIASSSAVNGATNNVVKNCNISGFSINTTIAGIIAGSSTYGNPAAAANSNNTIQNNQFTNLQNGAYIYGVTTGAYDANWTITGNLFTNLGFRGFLIAEASNFVVSNNIVDGLVNTGNTFMSGMQFAGDFAGGNIFNNKIGNIRNNFASWGCNGLWLDASTGASNINVYNNFIYNVWSPTGFTGGFSYQDNGYALLIDDGGGYNIYENTISQAASATSSTGIACAVNVDNTTFGTMSGSINMRDNIIVNNQGAGATRYAIRSTAPASFFPGMNYNSYFSTGQIGRVGGVNRNTLAQMQAGFGNNLNSIVFNPSFLSSTDLHLQVIAGNNPLNAGTFITTPSITTDIDGNTRATPTIGADELIFCPPAITGSPTAVCQGSTTNYTDATAGGTWASGSTGVATVSATGVVTGIAPGTATISYTIGTCTVTKDVTVNPVTPILGSFTVCQGSNTTLTDVTAGGTWLSGNTSVATIVSGSGLLSGVAPGTSAITYTTALGCTATVVETVTALPTAILGNMAICSGSSSLLTDPVAGGVWSSSNTAVATVGALTGVVSGLGTATATATISYTIGGLCYVTATVTVNPSPLPVSGAATVCAGVTTSFSDASAGGTWSSSNTGVAIIGSGTGIALGIVGGTTTISYVLPGTGCSASLVLTVNTSPVAISGNHSLCMGLSTPLSDVTPGGTWSSSNPAVATIVSGSGLATGVSNGTSTITYLLSTGCTAITEVTVNPVPGTINGTTNGCIGFTTTLTDATPGGTWSSSAPVIATIGSSTGVVNALSAGNTTMTYTLVSTGCYSTMLFTVNPPPAVIIGSSYICAGSSSIYNDASPGGTWSSSNSAIVSIGSSSGVAVGNATGNADITYTLASTTCYRTLAITVTTPPTPISGSGTVCNSYTSTLSDGTPGGIWSTTTGSGSVLVGSTTGIVTGLSTGTAIVSYTTFACPQVFRVITINPLPAPITGPGSVCAGSTVTLSDITPGGTWSATGATVSSTGVVTGLTVSVPASVTYTLPTGCYQQVPVSVSPVPDTIRGTDTVCPGSFVILTDLTPGGVWSSSDGTVAEAIAMTGQVNGLTAGTVTLSYTLVSGCAATMSFRVLTPLPAWLKVSTSPLDSALCHNTPVTLSTTDSNAGAPTFVWKLFGTIYMGTGPTLTYNPQHGDFITVTMTTHSVCASPAVIAKDVVLNVWPEVGPIVDISCTQADTISYIGEVYTFYSVVTYGGPAPLYQWYINNVAVAGANAPVFTTHIYNDNDTIYCKVTGNSPCDTGSFIGYSNTKVVYGLGFLAVDKVAGAANDLTLFPNPNNGAFVLNGTLGNSTDTEVALEVVDMLGRTVYTGTTTPQNGKLHAEIKLNTEASGNYLLRIHTESGNETFHFVVGK